MLRVGVCSVFGCVLFSFVDCLVFGGCVLFVGLKGWCCCVTCVVMLL